MKFSLFVTITASVAVASLVLGPTSSQPEIEPVSVEAVSTALVYSAAVNAYTGGPTPIDTGRTR